MDQWTYLITMHHIKADDNKFIQKASMFPSSEYVTQILSSSDLMFILLLFLNIWHFELVDLQKIYMNDSWNYARLMSLLSIDSSRRKSHSQCKHALHFHISLPILINEFKMTFMNGLWLYDPQESTWINIQFRWVNSDYIRVDIIHISRNMIQILYTNRWSPCRCFDVVCMLILRLTIIQ
jgi:hypothetical protein